MSVLVIDDMRSIQLVIRQMLRALGHRATAVSSGAEALESPDLGLFDLVLIDENMPGLTGVQTAAAMVRLFPDRPFGLILMSGDNSTERAMQSPHIDGFLAKPFSLEALTEELERWQSALA